MGQGQGRGGGFGISANEMIGSGRPPAKELEVPPKRKLTALTRPPADLLMERRGGRLYPISPVYMGHPSQPAQIVLYFYAPPFLIYSLEERAGIIR